MSPLFRSYDELHQDVIALLAYATDFKASGAASFLPTEGKTDAECLALRLLHLACDRKAKSVGKVLVQLAGDPHLWRAVHTAMQKLETKARNGATFAFAGIQTSTATLPTHEDAFDTETIPPMTAPTAPTSAAASPSPTDQQDGGDERQKTPTPGYCLIPPNKVRWDGEAEVQPQLYHLLTVLLNSRQWPVPFDAVENAVSDGSKRVSNAISRLNQALEPIKFPWIFRTKSAHILQN